MQTVVGNAAAVVLPRVEKGPAERWSKWRNLSYCAVPKDSEPRSYLWPIPAERQIVLFLQ